jgi:hypothetical protein
MDIKDQEARSLRELLSFPKIGLPEYSTELQTQRRVGSILSGILKRQYFFLDSWHEVPTPERTAR